MNPESLIRFEAELEYGVPIHDEVIQVTPANTDEVPRLAITRHGGGYEVHVRGGLPTAEQDRYRKVNPDVLFNMSLDEVNQQSFGFARIVQCYWYCISRIPSPSEFPDVAMQDGRFVVVRDGQIASVAWSAQDDERASEVEVETNEAYRRRGFGRQVVAAWAHHVRREGKLAFYSHLITNMASQALAESVGAWKYAESREFF